MSEEPTHARPSGDQDGDASQQKSADRAKRLWRDWIRPVLIVVVLLAVLRSSGADWHDVPSGSMTPTIVPGDRIVVNKLAYDLKIPFTDQAVLSWGEPEQGDLVTFWSPNDRTRMVKRVVAVGGDVVQVRGDRLFVNGRSATYENWRETTGRRGVRRVADESVDGRTRTVQFQGRRGGPSFGPERVPEGHYFMMGDNRHDSEDSRVYGTVPKHLVNGQVFAVATSFEPGEGLSPRWDRWLSSLE